MLWGLVLVPVVAAIVTAAVRRHHRMDVVVPVVAIALVLGLGLWAALAAPTATWRWSSELTLTLRVAAFSRVMVVLVPLVALPVVAFAAATERTSRERLLALMVAFVGAMQLLVSAGDLLTLLIGWELVGATSWALIGHGWRQVRNVQAAGQAFVTTRVGDLGLYLAAGLTFASVGSFDLAAIAQLDGVRLHLVAAGVLLAAAAKSAQLPFSPWLFAAMAGPTPVSALLHSATLVSAGAYLLIRIGPSLSPVEWFLPTVAVLGVATALAGGLVALTQQHIKRVLAGSTSAQYGLMFVAVGAGSAAAAGAQLVAHALFKSLLFLAAGVAIHATGTSRLDRMHLARPLPRIAALAAVGALALAAVPPLGSGWSKEQIVATALASSGWLGAATLVAASLTAAYAARLWWLAFGPGGDEPGSVTAGARPGGAEVTALAVLAAGSILLGLLWLPGGADVAESLTGGRLIHGPPGAFVAALAAIVVAIAAVAHFHRRRRLLSVGLPAAVGRGVASWFGLEATARVVATDPVLRLATGLRAVDDRVIDAGVRATTALAAWVSRTLSHVGELSFSGAAHALAGAALRTSRFLRRRAEQAIDAAVRGTAAGTDLAAVASRRLDDRGIDGAVEGLATGTGQAGQRARQTQTGLSHQYYLYATVGGGLLVLVLVVLR